MTINITILINLKINPQRKSVQFYINKKTIQNQFIFISITKQFKTIFYIGIEYGSSSISEIIINIHHKLSIEYLKILIIMSVLIPSIPKV